MSDNLSVKQLANAFGIGLTKAYELVNQPDFPSFRIGRKILVPYDKAKEWQRHQIDLNEQEKSRA